MSPRRNNRRRDAAEQVDEGRARRGVEAVETSSDGEWLVRALPGSTNGKTYRCPGCDQEIPASVPHTVAWLADGDPTDRRHWHTPCWRSRSRRAPTGQRSRTARRY